MVSLMLDAGRKLGFGRGNSPPVATPTGIVSITFINEEERQ